MVYLLILFSLKDIFSFCTKNMKQKSSWLVLHTQQALHNLLAAHAVVTVIPPYHLTHLGILFLSRWRVYGDSAWFGLKLLFYSFFLHRIACSPWKNSFQLFILFLLLIQFLFSYLQVLNLHWLFLIWFYFCFYPWSFDF